jgi:hypothetical protein
MELLKKQRIPSALQYCLRKADKIASLKMRRPLIEAGYFRHENPVKTARGIPQCF